MFKPIVARITIITALLLILPSRQIVAQTGEVFNPDLMCSLLPNGTKIKDPRYCNVYIDCINNGTVTGTCGAQFYDRNSGECVDPDTIKCLSSDPCAGKSDGFTADPYSCNGYYYCSNGVGAHGECSPGLNFNPASQNCVRNFTCEITLYPEDYCNIVPEGVFIKDPNSCTSYQTCWQSKLINGTCPNGFYYDSFMGDCNYPKYVNCVQPTPEIPADVKCTADGIFISDGRTCNGYYYCNANEDGGFDLIFGTCPVDRFFDPANNGQCVPRTSIACRFNRCVTLGLDYIQLANIDGDGCTGFSICQSGVEINRSECPSGQYFDEMSQFCVDERITYPACVQSNTTTPATAATNEISTTMAATTTTSLITTDTTPTAAATTAATATATATAISSRTATDTTAAATTTSSTRATTT